MNVIIMSEKGFYPMIQGKMTSPKPIYCSECHINNQNNSKSPLEKTMHCYSVGYTDKFTTARVPYNYYECDVCGNQLLKILVWKDKLSFIEKENIFGEDKE